MLYSKLAYNFHMWGITLIIPAEILQIAKIHSFPTHHPYLTAVLWLTNMNWIAFQYKTKVLYFIVEIWQVPELYFIVLFKFDFILICIGNVLEFCHRPTQTQLNLNKSWKWQGSWLSHTKPQTLSRYFYAS